MAGRRTGLTVRRLWGGLVGLRRGPWLAGSVGTLLLALPLTTWVVRHPLPTADPRHAAQQNVAVTQTPEMLLLVGAVGAVALELATSDLWLGVGIGYLALDAWRIGHADAVGIVLVLALGGWLLTRLRRLPSEWIPAFRAVAIGLGLVQVGYAGLQRVGIDPLWPASAHQVHGTLGNPNWLGAYLGLLTPLAPWSLVPVFWGGLLLVHSRLGMVAAAVGLLVRAPTWTARGALLGGAGLSGWILSQRWEATEVWKSGAYRLMIWGWALRDWWSVNPLFGVGPGAWYHRVPAVQLAQGNPMVELFAQAHNDVLQLGYEGGAIALGCLGGWLWTHRWAWRRRTPWVAAAAALGVVSLGMFPFHVPTLAGMGIVILALATREEVRR